MTQGWWAAHLFYQAYLNFYVVIATVNVHPGVLERTRNGNHWFRWTENTNLDSWFKFVFPQALLPIPNSLQLTLASQIQSGMFVCDEAGTKKKEKRFFVDHQSDGIKGISLPGQCFPVIRVVSNCYPQLDILFIWIFMVGTRTKTQTRRRRRAVMRAHGVTHARIMT